MGVIYRRMAIRKNAQKCADLAPENTHFLAWFLRELHNHEKH